MITLLSRMVELMIFYCPEVCEQERGLDLVPSFFLLFGSLEAEWLKWLERSSWGSQLNWLSSPLSADLREACY